MRPEGKKNLFGIAEINSHGNYARNNFITGWLLLNFVRWISVQLFLLGWCIQYPCRYLSMVVGFLPPCIIQPASQPACTIFVTSLSGQSRATVGVIQWLEWPNKWYRWSVSVRIMQCDRVWEKERTLFTHTSCAKGGGGNR